MESKHNHGGRGDNDRHQREHQFKTSSIQEYHSVTVLHLMRVQDSSAEVTESAKSDMG